MQKLLKILERYNPWKGQLYDVGLVREEYLQKISDFLGTRIIKVITGQRRSGKSYLIRQVINQLIEQHNVRPQNIFYLNKELVFFDEIKTYKELNALFKVYLDQIQPQGKVYVFLDEVQMIEGWEKFVSSYSQDFQVETEIFVTGSNAKMLSKELATLLTGRYVEIEVLPFSYLEFLQYTGKRASKLSFEQYLKTGGLPEMMNISSAEARQFYVESLKNTIILRDIVERFRVKDLQLLDKLFRFLLLNIGNRMSVSSIVRYFKSIGKPVNFNTIAEYLSYLTSSYLFHQAKRMDVKTKSVFKTDAKFYINDLSFRNYLYGELYFNPAAYLENYVYLTLKRKGYQVFVGNLRSGEIDFIATKGKDVLYFQVAYLLESDQTVEREISSLLRAKDNYPKYLVTMDDFNFGQIKGIKHLQAWGMEGRSEI